MKKNLIYLTGSLLIFQLVNAQTNPALLTNFKIDGSTDAGYKISWNIANNEVVSKFDLQKSTNGTDFTTIAVFIASQKTGTEIYKYNENNTSSTRVMYRLKMTSKGYDIYYSSIVVLSVKPKSNEKISILGNPVKDMLTIRFNEFQSQSLDINIYDLAGRNISHTTISRVERNNIINIPLNMSMSPGVYIAEVQNGVERLTCKFLKQ